jgi:hypothetical protein
VAPVHAAQHGTHHGFVQPPPAVGDGLVGERQPSRIEPRAARASSRSEPSSAGTPSACQHPLQVFAHGGRRHRPQVELQAAAQHRGQHLVGVGGGQHELQVVGRLFQRLEQGVEGVLGELVRLVDHEDLEAADARLVGRALDQVADLVLAAVAGGVQLDVVDVAVGVDLGAGLAHAAGLGGDAALPSGPVQFRLLARMRLTVVLPMPRVPVNR